MTDRGGTRSGTDRRKFQYTAYIPEKDRAGTVEKALIVEAQ